MIIFRSARDEQEMMNIGQVFDEYDLVVVAITRADDGRWIISAQGENVDHADIDKDIANFNDKERDRAARIPISSQGDPDEDGDEEGVDGTE